MAGAVASLNVSVAAAVILYEAQRQRAAGGLYDGCRLDEATCQRLLFEWATGAWRRATGRRGSPTRGWVPRARSSNRRLARVSLIGTERAGAQACPLQDGSGASSYPMMMTAARIPALT